MANRKLVGAEARALIDDQIQQHSAGVRDTLSKFQARSAVGVWINALRAVEEFINLPLFELEPEAAMALSRVRLDNLDPRVLMSVREKIRGQFEAGVADRFAQTMVQSAAIGQAFRIHGFEAGEEFGTVGGAIGYFQSRRRQMVALLYCMPAFCTGADSVSQLDALNVFLPVVEHSCIGLTDLYRHVVLQDIFSDYELDVGAHGFSGNRSFNFLNESFLEPERVAITEMPPAAIDTAAMRRRVEVDPGRVFSTAELCNDLLAMEATYAEFKLSETDFGPMARFIVALSGHSHDEYHVELDGSTLKCLMDLCGLSASARRRLVYDGTGYVDAINSFAPFIQVDRRFLTTVTLLSRFAYSWKTACLNRIKRFQIRSGFIFEGQVRQALEEQGHSVCDVKRIEQKEFDVITIKDGVIYNIQCKNNLVDLAKIEAAPRLFVRYNRRLDRYYADALLKEESRENLLKQRFGLYQVKHVVLSKFPIATDNPRVLAFHDINQFAGRFTA